MFLCTTVLLHFDTMLSNLVSGVSMKSQLNTIDKIIPYSCNIASRLHTFDSVLSDFRFLSFNVKSQTDIMKKIIPYSCCILPLFLHFDTLLSNLVYST